MRNRKFIVGGAIILFAVAFLGYKGFVESATSHYSVAEFNRQKSEFADQVVLVSGNVSGNTIEMQGLKLAFTLSDGQNYLPVIYAGVVPGSFAAGIEAVVKGKLNSAGVFEANELLVKCPSKYAPEEAPSQ